MPVKTLPEYDLRYFRPDADLQAVLDIEAEACAYYDEDLELTVVHPHVWTEAGILSFMAGPDSIGYVITDASEKIVGFMLYELLSRGIHLGAPATYTQDFRPGK